MYTNTQVPSAQEGSFFLSFFIVYFNFFHFFFFDERAKNINKPNTITIKTLAL